MKAVSQPDTLEFFKGCYDRCEIRYGDMKKQLAEDIIAVVRPIRERIEAIQADDKYLHEVVTAGAEKARASARKTLAEVREIMGIHKF